MGRRCFVIMPFASEFAGVWDEVLRPTIVSIGDVCVRGDDFFTPGVIMQDVFREVENADYLIADLTNKNANVFYELGYAHALKKPVVLITQQILDIPFDLRHHRVIGYENTIAGAMKLKGDLLRWLPQIHP